jgi:hypothetical protein
MGINRFCHTDCHIILRLAITTHDGEDLCNDDHDL